MSDLAQHPKDVLMQVWGEYPTCIAEGCDKRAIDPHHVKKKGNKKDKEDRKIHSSIMGCAPLCREHHNRGDKHYKESEDYYLQKIYERTQVCGYEPNEIDHKFMEKYSDSYINV